MFKEYKVDTKLGPIFIYPTEANHLHVSSRSNGSEHLVAPVRAYKDLSPVLYKGLLTLRGCDYYVSAHFHAYKDGTFNIGPEFCEKGVLTNSYQRGQSLYISNRTASQSARTKLTEVLTEAVNKWVSENGDKLYDAETNHVKDKLDRRIADLNKAKELTATIEADIKKLKLELGQHKNGGK